jgi:hypothetical protein
MSEISQQPREKLREILTRTGEGLLQDPDRCEGLLKDHCGPYRREISALVGALEERVPLELKSSWQSAMTPEAMRARLVQRLEDNRGLAPQVAEWAVDTWSYALGVGLERGSDRLDSQVISGTPIIGLTPSQPLPNNAERLSNNAEFGNAGNAELRGSQQQFSQPQQQTSQVVAPPQPEGWSTGKKMGAAVAALLVLGAVYSQKDRFINTTPVDPCAQITDGKSGVKADVGKDASQTCPDKNKQVTPTPTPVVEVSPTIVAQGTPLQITVNEALTSDTAKEGQYVAATVQAPVVVEGKTIIPAGTKAVLQVMNVDQAGKLIGAAQIHLVLAEMTVNGKKLTVHTDQASIKGPSKTVSTAKKTGALGAVGCGVGAAIGKITRHAARGCGVGAAGGAATGAVLSSRDKPKPAVSVAGRELRFRLSQPLSVG